MASRTPRNGLETTLAWTLVGATVLTIVISVMLSPAQLGWMREHWVLFNWPMLRIENLGIRTGLNIQHILMFMWLAFLLRMVWRKAIWWKIILILAVLGAGTELLQVFLPGRDPRISDVRDDILGGFLGLLIAVVLVRLGAAIARNWKVRPSSASTGEDSGTAWEAGAWVLAILRGDVDVAMPTGTIECEAALQAARDEGVVSLLHESLCAQDLSARTPTTLLNLFADGARTAAARSLRVLAECRRISNALAVADVPAIWLKGAALAQWLYPQPHLRDADDVDLLLPSHCETMRAAATVEPLGYTLPNRHIAGDLVVHELLAFSPHVHLELDLHWDLSNNALYADRLRWNELSAQALDLPALGEQARGLAPVHALLHAAIHRSLNQLTGRSTRLRWLYDLHLFAGRLSPVDWQALQILAIERGLAGTCHAALEATASTLGTRIPPVVMQTLAGRMQQESLQCDRLGSWTYMQWATLRALPDWGRRGRWLRQLMIPDMTHLRERYGGDGVGHARVLYRRLADGVGRWWRYHAPD